MDLLRDRSLAWIRLPGRLLLAALLLLAPVSTSAEEPWSAWQVAVDADGGSTGIEWRARYGRYNQFMTAGKPPHAWDLELRNTNPFPVHAGFHLTEPSVPATSVLFDTARTLEPGETGKAWIYTHLGPGGTPRLWLRYDVPSTLVVADRLEQGCEDGTRTWSLEVLSGRTVKLQVVDGVSHTFNLDTPSTRLSEVRQLHPDTSTAWEELRSVICAPGVEAGWNPLGSMLHHANEAFALDCAARPEEEACRVRTPTSHGVRD